MKTSKLLLFNFSMIILSCKSQTRESNIEILQPSLEQEASAVWRTVNDIAFLESQGYSINLPKDSLIESLIIKSKKGTFGNEDFSSIYTLLETKYFDRQNYELALQKVEDQIGLLNEFIDEIYAQKSKWDWTFQTFSQYKIVFTLYGTGGSYDPDKGIITLLTNKEGGFMKYQNPAYTIIHEISHIGMEYSLVQKYNLSHGLKERLVDTFVFLMFQEELPEYQIQDMGNSTMDKYFVSKESIES